ncbi:hypothetical protein C7T94_05235 [Pedobacter yulinensis]|uniref:Signal transduction histidine kinase internal region domain-containing protein n=1 Tax=Pedobacter yulinensis TaxID=2126353 RepID=A0A2T3HP09_9SPHI|nr:histidine kinase [Pedobacter yulinensis]PST84133.1 hypothetical protein C7T94_05235 [Pedobacter yulinensis]
MKKNVHAWLKRYRTEILVWAAFIAYETLLLRLVAGVSGAAINYAVHYSLTIFCFYAFATFALPWAFAESRQSARWRGPLTFIGYFPFYICLHHLGDVLLTLGGMPISASELRLDRDAVLRNAYRGIFFMGLATGYYYLFRFARQQREQKALRAAQYEQLQHQRNTERALFEARSAYMKAQISPHFLFNTLDYVYHTIGYNNQQAAEAILILSRMMRYAASPPANEGYIRLGEELEHVRNLLKLYALRKDQGMAIDIQTDEKATDLPFIPLALMTLVENMVKHGAASGRDACLRVKTEAGFLHIESRNRMPARKDSSGTGTGLRNLRARLQQAYGTEARLEIRTTAHSEFIVRIRLPVVVLHGHDGPAAT